MHPERDQERRRQGGGTAIRWLRAAGALLVFAALTGGCSQGVLVTEAEFGTDWPFTVPHGRLTCQADREITFLWRGTEYSLNGGTSREGTYTHAGRISADAPGGGRKPFAPLIERGMQLCG